MPSLKSIIHINIETNGVSYGSIKKNILFISTLIYAGIYDYKRRIIPDRVHVIIMISALLSQFSIIQSILGLLILPIPFIIPIFFNENCIGGEEI